MMDKWHWRFPRQIKEENTVIYSFSLFLKWWSFLPPFSVSKCLFVCLLCSVFECFWVSSFDVYGECVSHLSMSQRAVPGSIYYVSWPKGSRLGRGVREVGHFPMSLLLLKNFNPAAYKFQACCLQIFGLLLTNFGLLLTNFSACQNWIQTNS